MVRRTRTIALAVLLALFAAGAVHALPGASRPVSPETRTLGLLDGLRHWFTSLLFRGPLSAVWGQAGGVMDPNGGMTSVSGKEGSDMDPNGGLTRVWGMEGSDMDPDGLMLNAGSDMDPNGGAQTFAGSQMDPNG